MIEKMQPLLLIKNYGVRRLESERERKITITLDRTQCTELIKIPKKEKNSLHEEIKKSRCDSVRMQTNHRHTQATKRNVTIKPLTQVTECIFLHIRYCSFLFLTSVHLPEVSQGALLSLSPSYGRIINSSL